MKYWRKQQRFIDLAACTANTLITNNLSPMTDMHAVVSGRESYEGVIVIQAVSKGEHGFPARSKGDPGLPARITFRLHLFPLRFTIRTSLSTELQPPTYQHIRKENHNGWKRIHFRAIQRSPAHPKIIFKALYK